MIEAVGDAFGVVFVHEIHEDVAQLAVGQELGGFLNTPLDRGIVLEFQILARREQADHDDHAALVGLADQPLQPFGELRLQRAFRRVAVLARVDIGPTAVRTLDVDADAVDAVSNHVVEIANMAFGDGIAVQGIAAAQAPQVDLLTAEERTVVAHLELARRGRRILSGVGGGLGETRGKSCER